VRLRVCLALLAGLAGACGQAREIRLCMTEREFLPISSPAFEAPGQYLVRAAIERQGDRVLFVAVPWRRCVEGLRHDEYDGAIGMVAADGFRSFMRFPMAGAEPDASKTVGDLLYVSVRLKGGTANWDGERFQGLARPVIYNAPSLVLADKMRRLGAGNPNTSLGENQMLAMLLAGRADIAVGRKEVIEALAAREPFRDKIEILPVPFVSATSYLAFRKSFADPVPGYAQHVWDEIGRLRSSPDWPAARERLLAERGRRG
jgi:polar amino acid transport system substrate-binding protein